MSKNKYRKDFPDKAEFFAEQGLSNKQIAAKLKVSERSFRTYLRKYPALAAAVEQGRFPLEKMVEDALLKRVLGFKQEEINREEIIDKKTGEVLDVLKCRKVVKEVAPDVRALLFWLKNRFPDRWRDKPEDGLSDDYRHEFDDQDMRL